MKARSHAVKILLEVVVARRSFDSIWQHYTQLHQLGREEPFVRALCFGVLRYYTRLCALVNYLLSKPLRSSDQAVYVILLCAFYQILYMRVPAYATVSEAQHSSVALQKPWAKGLINALLRRFLRQQDDILYTIDLVEENKFSMPRWLLLELKKQWPQEWQHIVHANLQYPPPFCLRVNLRRQSRTSYRLKLLEHTVTEGCYAPASLYLEQACAVQTLFGFSDGEVSVQDEAAQMVVCCLPLKGRQRVLDACAAPGGKTAALLESYPDLELVAIDKNAERLRKVDATLSRLALTATVQQGDASQPQTWWDGQAFDAILLDAPCSATGVIRRHPDIKLLRRSSDISQLAQQQSAMLAALWPLLKEGGYLLYATCSVLPQENHHVIQNFVNSETSAEVISLNGSAQASEDSVQQIEQVGHLSPWGLQILPGEANMDGFFYSLLQKQAESR